MKATTLVSAARAGQTRYNTGQPCIRDHRKPSGEVEDRLTLSGGHCAQCHAGNSKAVRAARRAEFNAAKLVKPMFRKVKG